MRKIKMMLMLMTVIPVIFILAVLASPFYAICYWAGEEKAIDAMLDRVAARLSAWTSEFVGS
mgnify:CR=1 FL=1